MVSVQITPHHLTTLSRILLDHPKRMDLIVSLVVQIVVECWIERNQAVAILECKDICTSVAELLEAWWKLDEADKAILGSDGGKILQVWIINRLAMI